MQFPREHKTQTTSNKSDLDPREISEETVLVHKKVGKCQLEGPPLTTLKDSYGDLMVSVFVSNGAFFYRSAG